PELCGAFGHHIDMALQDQAAARPLALVLRLIGRNNLVGAFERNIIHRRGLGMTCKVDIGETELIDLVAAFAELLRKPWLDGLLPAAQARELDHAPQEGDLILEIAIDGLAQPLRQIIRPALHYANASIALSPISISHIPISHIPISHVMATCPPAHSAEPFILPVIGP